MRGFNPIAHNSFVIDRMAIKDSALMFLSSPFLFYYLATLASGFQAFTILPNSLASGNTFLLSEAYILKSTKQSGAKSKNHTSIWTR